MYINKDYRITTVGRGIFHGMMGLVYLSDKNPKTFHTKYWFMTAAKVPRFALESVCNLDTYMYIWYGLM